MKTKLFALALLLSLSLTAVAQTETLPEFGTIADIKGMTRVYVVTDSTQSRKYVLEELKKYKALEVVSSPDDAQFLLELKVNSHVATSGLIREMDTYEMTAYTMKGNRRRIAWSATKTSLRYPPVMLTRDLISALKKAAK